MRTDNIQLNLYRTFIFAAKDRNLTITAEKMNCDQSNISKQLKQLEAEFGKKLYVKSKKGIELTEIGQKLYEDLNKAYNMLLLAEKHFNEMDGIEKGKLSIGINSDIRKYYFENKLDSFKNMYPNLNIKLLDTTANEMYKRLENYNIDIMIGFFNDNTPFESINIINDELCYAYAENFSLNLERELSLILPVKENEIRTIIDHYLLKNNINYKLKYELSNFSDIAEYVKKGYGLAIIPICIAKANNLKIMPLKEKIDYNVNMFYDKNNLSGSAKEFIKHIKE